MNENKKFISQQWLIGLSNASYVFAGFLVGLGDKFAGVCVGILGVGLGALQYNIAKREELKHRQESYADGYAHGNRRTGSR